MNTESHNVLGFWFGEPPAITPRTEWFQKNDDFDRDIERRFGPLIERALRHALSAWRSQAAAALAEIVVLDQFTRNVFRNTPRAFAGDPLALEAARAMVRTGQHAELPPLQRVFAYLPFEHDESIASQDESVRLYTALHESAPGMDGFLDYAHRHRDVIARFGRFPHRNAIVGRASTPEETAFLAQPGSSF